MEGIKIVISEDFNDKLGGRWKSLGPYSGEEFYDTLLRDKYLDADKKGVKLNIYMDGAKGYGSSFLDQSFGELARNYGVDKVSRTIVFHTTLFNWHVNYIKEKIWVSA